MISKMKKLSLVILKSDEDAILNDLLWLKTIEVSDPGDVSGDSIVVRRDCSQEILSSKNRISALESAIKLLSPKSKCCCVCRYRHLIVLNEISKM